MEQPKKSAKDAIRNATEIIRKLPLFEMLNNKHLEFNKRFQHGQKRI